MDLQMVVLVVFVVLLVALMYLGASWQQVGTDTEACYAVVTVFGRPTGRVLTVGRHFVWRPFQSLWLVPTKQFSFDYYAEEILTQRKDGYAEQVIRVLVSVYLQFPTPEEKYRITLPNGKGEAATTEVRLGSELLVKTFFANPARNLFDKSQEEQLGRHLAGEVVAAVRTTMGRRTWLECKRDEDEMIESDVETLLFGSPDSPFVALGISGRGIVGIRVQRVEIPEELERSLAAPELAQREGEAGVVRAEHEGSAERGRTTREGEGAAGFVGSMTGEQVSPNVAAGVLGLVRAAEHIGSSLTR